MATTPLLKVALLIGVSEYSEDSGFRPLPAPQKDVEALKRVLELPEIGGFTEVETLINPTQSEMAVKIETWLADRKRDELALLFYSGHGAKDERRELYFSARDTRKQKGKLLRSTAVSAEILNKWIQDSYVARFVLILDCCFSGAFGDLLVRDDDSVDYEIQNQLGSEGRVVLTASSSIQYSFEKQGSDSSIYTQCLLEGLETGSADLNKDGWISIKELHDYAKEKVNRVNKNMTPRIITLQDEGFDIVLARSPKYERPEPIDNDKEKLEIAIEQANLNLKSDELENRLSGIRSLDEISRDTDKYNRDILKILSSFVRTRAAWQPNIFRDSIEQDVQEGLEVISNIPKIDPRSQSKVYYVVDLHNVDISGANLEGANLEGVVLWGSNLRNVNLARSNLIRADLGGNDFTDASLEMSNLEGAFLWWSAPLEPVRPCTFERTRLSGANFKDANLEGAILVGAIGLTKRQIDVAIINENTRLPWNK
jgi:hypothetical protein